ncbi:acetyl-CoA carboxylase biotin carboxyl carrier protein [Lactiplantibacillus modestisalitolerans]|uniref:Acetyl-CoA carboxylase biotin carboxyl carrier protein n=1 Tax=Lactiplantibacillus modestisalitolerans TaxID=1457219 RepID=A0ABV5WRD8_9LACO|nr:biotin/lipoyl-containing protein [Lactiplantibacillus modestisalitolerans]
MELKEIDRLVEKYARQGYQHIRVKAGELEVEVARTADPATAPQTSVTPAAAAKQATTETVTSPMVGVVHLDQDIQVGQRITAGQELGQIESMKLFNPLKSPVDGQLAAILVKDNAAVEYQQPLFTLRKDR